ncbi:kinase-like domain-containing protein [Melanogaster broomeanus]|nr:kinase-like domain-containing protein [Melanogaster broomeanus]
MDFVGKMKLFRAHETQSKPQPRPNIFRKILSSIKLSSPSFKFGSKVSHITAPPQHLHLTPVSDAPAPPEQQHPERVPGASVVFTPVTTPTPASLALRSQEIDIPQELGDTPQDPEEFDVIRQANLLALFVSHPADQTPTNVDVTEDPVDRDIIIRDNLLALLRRRVLPAANTVSPVHQPLRSCSHNRSEAPHPVVETPRWGRFSSILTLLSPKEVDVCIEQFQVLSLLGAGAYGRVIKKRLLHTCEVVTIIAEQAALVRMLGNPHALQLVASFHDSANFYMAVELKTGGDLETRIYESGGIPVDIARYYAAEMVVGLFSLHKRGLLHRDIKPGNILFDESGHVIIADFGLSKVFDLGDAGNSINILDAPHGFNGDNSQRSQASYLASGCWGTFSHMAPEMLLQEKYGFSVDYWALAVTIYEMLTGKIPWEGNGEEDLMRKICYAPLVCPDTMTAEAKDLLKKMLVKAPMERITYNEIARILSLRECNDWKKIESRPLASPSVPMQNAKLEERAYRVDDIERGRTYTPEADPLPQFSWSSSSNIKWHRHSPFVRKAIVLVRIVQRISGWLSSCKGWHRKSPKTFPSTSRSAESPDEAVPVVRDRENILMDDSEPWEEWAVGFGSSISGGSSLSSTLMSLPPSDYEHHPASDVEQTLADYVFPATPHRPLRRRRLSAALLEGGDRGWIPPFLPSLLDVHAGWLLAVQRRF